MTEYGFEKLRLACRLAIADGHEVRSSSDRPRRAEKDAEAQMLSAQREARVRDVLSALPRRITREVALAAELPVRRLVMYVQPGEYEGASTTIPISVQ